MSSYICPFYTTFQHPTSHIMPDNLYQPIHQFLLEFDDDEWMEESRLVSLSSSFFWEYLVIDYWLNVPFPFISVALQDGKNILHRMIKQGRRRLTPKWERRRQWVIRTRKGIGCLNRLVLMDDDDQHKQEINGRKINDYRLIVEDGVWIEWLYAEKGEYTEEEEVEKGKRRRRVGQEKWWYCI